MAGKSSKNPLLSGAGIGFPFENFTNSTLLVPVPQNEPPFIPEEIEADSFLGQEPQRRGSSSLKPLPSLVGSISKSLSNVAPESSSTTELRTHFQSEPQLQAASYSLVPEFTKSFTGGLHTAKPTPLYADALSQPASVQPTTYNSILRSAEVSKPLVQPPPSQPPSSLLFSNQAPANFTAPSILNPALASVSFDSSSTHHTTNFQSPSSSSSPVASSPAHTPLSSNSLAQSAQSSNQLLSNTPSSAVFTPLVPVPLNNTDSNVHYSNQHHGFSSPPNLTSVIAPITPNTSPPTSSWVNSITGSSNPSSSVLNSNQTFSNFSSPSIFTPALSSDTLPSQVPNFGRSSSSTPSILNPSPIASLSPVQSAQSSVPQVSSAPQQSLFSYFSTSNPPQQTTSVAKPLPFESPSTTPVTHPPLIAAAPPLSGKTSNSYRLSNIKRPTYTRPPELEVTPMGTMPSPLPPSTPQPATLFTPDPSPVPAQRDVTDAVPPPPTPVYRLPSQAEASVLPPSFANLAQGNIYRPVYHHWFYKKMVEGKVLWNPFTMQDSLNLEEAFTSATIAPETKVATDGGRYDVEVLRRRRTAVYWQEESSEVRRCSWFVKGGMDARYTPYEENIATMLEEEYRKASSESKWNHEVQLPDGEMIIMHSPNAIAHHTRSASFDEWGNSPQMQPKPKVVKRGMDEFDINDGEPEKIDHLLFLVHGIGKFCDMKFRPVTEVVDDFRSISLQLIQSHFKEAMEAGQVGRVEVLPIPWHDALHSAHIDQRLNRITLTSIPRLRHFTNDTLLDILFYTSPIFCETIVQAVGSEMNRLYDLFLSRNPSFEGGVSLGGHSLGSLILFDMLCNQKSEPQSAETTSPPASPTTTQEQPAEIAAGGEEVKALGCMSAQKSKLSRSVSYVTIGKAGTGQPFICYPQLKFKPKAFFALGSPIGMFITVRGIESLGEDFALPTCPLFFNIFHPFDPVAYRVESLVNADSAKYSPLLIPHHKGRKRMHLELKDTLEHVGAALKQKLMESVRSTWNTVCQSMFTRVDDSAIDEMNKAIEKEIIQSQSCSGESASSLDNGSEAEVKMGQLNSGRRIDYVLQEAPFESFNEYVFALTSHVCYWESEDTMLMMLKEMYGTMGVSPDTQVVQQILPFEPPEGLSSHQQYVSLPSVSSEAFGMDPTAPISDNISVGPPPTTGFFRQ